MDNIQELLKPRYKVIADFPKCMYISGELLPRDSNWNFELFAEHYVDEAYLKKYPHLFRKLEWWEEREEKDMPEYVKDESGKILVAKWVMENSWLMKMVLYKSPGELQVAHYFVNKNTMCFFLPATQSEYEAFKKQSNG
jgi:hypothetical protein